METETETKQKAREGNQDVNRAQATEKEKEKNQVKPEERNQDYQHRLHQSQSQNPNRRHQSECWQDQQMAQKVTQTEPAHCQQVLPLSLAALLAAAHNEGQIARVQHHLSLYKTNITANEYLIHHRIPTLPPLVINRISKEDTLPGLGLERATLVLLHMRICPAAKDTEMGNRWFTTVEYFKWRFTSYSNGGGEVESVQIA